MRWADFDFEYYFSLFRLSVGQRYVYIMPANILNTLKLFSSNMNLDKWRVDI